MSNRKLQIPSNEMHKAIKLESHISQVHPKVYSTLFPNEISQKKEAEIGAFNIIQDAIELVTVNGYPFSMLNASGMKGFVKARLQNIAQEQYIPPINRNEIAKYVANESDLVKKRITEELKGKTVSIMFDVCTKATLSMLGVHALFMIDSDVVCQSLGTIQIQERHTSVNLANLVFDILTDYNVTLPKVFSITTDTAYNAVATADILNLVASSNENSDIGEQSIFDMESDDDDFNFGIDMENEAELQKVMDNVAAQTQLVCEVAENFAEKSKSIMLLNHINCCAHVLQLAVNGALIESDAMQTIQIVHDMCNLMRTQVVMIHVRKLKPNLILPPMDNTTRWNSKFIMVRFFLYKQFKNSISNY